jgi:hypothetical protein
MALAALAGCGGDDGGGDPEPAAGGGPAAILTAALNGSEDTESYRMRFDLETDFGGESLTMRGDMVAAADGSRSWFKGRFADGGGKPERLEMVIDGDQAYLRGPGYDEILPAGKQWLRFAGDPTTTTMPPREFLAFLRESAKIEDAGTETIRGEQAVHLRGPLDMPKLVEETGGDAAEQFKQIPQAAKLAVHLDVWVAEADDRMLRMTMRMTHPDQTGSMEIDSDILEENVPLDPASAPDEDTVADPADVLG